MKKAGYEAIVAAEYRLLNALVRNDAYRDDSRIHEDLFVHEVAKSIYQAIDSLDRDGIPVTEASLFQRANEIDYSVTTSIISQIFNIDPEGPSTLDDILATLQVAKQKQQLSQQFEQLLKLTSSPGPLNTDKVLDALYKVDTILKSGSSSSLLKDFDRWSEEYIEDVKERSKGRRYSYGDDLLDKYIFKGAYPGAITTIAAATGQGKSTFVLNIINSLINLYVPCMYVSLEMDGIDTYDRLISLRREIPLEDLHKRDESVLSVIDIVEEERKLLKDNKKFYFVEEPFLSIAKLRSLIKEFKQRAKTDYAVIAVDLATQLTDFMHTRANISVANAIEEAMNNLNAIAKEQHVHIIAIVQFNREADNMKVHSIEDLDLLRPSLNNIKNSAAIGERSRVVLGLFRKKYYADRYLIGVEGADLIPDILECQVLKNSSGMVGQVLKYAFEGRYFRCTPLLEDDPSETPASSVDLDF